MPDYAITGRALIYTPIFMSGWAYEKMGVRLKACQAFSRFVEVAQKEAEATKREHVDQFLKDYCKK